MSNLENLTAKILADSEAKARQITEAAKSEADRIIAEQEAEANREKERILAQAEKEAQHSQEQIVLGRTLAIRDENLAAKQQMLDKVFGLALEKLNAMSKDDYWKFVSNYLAALDLDGEEIYFPAKYGVTSVAELNTFLKGKGKKGNLTLGKEAREIDGGFLLAKNGIEQNNTFAALVEYYRYELESEVLNALYQ